MSEHVAEVRFEKTTSKFVITNPRDPVQRHLYAGKFYEIEQMLFHRHLIPRDRAVADIGTNVGNHTIFYARHSLANRVICFEPNPETQAILRRNIELNRLATIDLRFLNYGIGAARAEFTMAPGSSDNLAAAQIVPASEESAVRFTVAPLDELLEKDRVSFIKIDVEGMEMEVLRGARKVLRRDRPSLAIEVVNRNIEEFFGWCSAARYHVIHAFRTRRSYINYLCISMR